MMKKLLVLAVLLQLCACATLPNTAVIEQSPNDDKQYRYLRLDNGLQVVLVSDQSASQSAAALNVYIGSAQNPQERAGLAHFLEHMLFLGTQKYPNAGEYQAFIKDNGGSHNAYTSFENTSYFFDVSTPAFPEALDRFAQFFVAPLLDAEYVKRETKAVNAEYFASLRDDNRRSLDVFRQQVNPQHPFSKFSVGNSKTLEDREQSPIVNDLKTFYQQYYSANLMTLALASPYSLDEMQAWVEQGFTSIAKHKVPNLKIKEPLFNQGQLPLWLTIKPIKNQRKLSLLFPLPELDVKQQKYLDAIAYVLGDESQGSLLSYLKSQNWATSLAAGGSLSYRGGDSFVIDIELTKMGLQYQKGVLDAVFAAINQLQQQGVAKPLYEQIAKLRQLEFQFLPQKTAKQQVIGITSNLHHYQPDSVLSGAYKYPAYNAKKIDKLVTYLQPDNTYILSFDPELEATNKTVLYRVPFSKKVPSIQQQQQWQTASNTAITLPKLNPFVPQNTDLVVSAENKNTEPKRLVKDDSFELWYQPLSIFEVPKQVTYIAIEYPDAHSDVENTVLMNLYVSYLQEAFNELLYTADVAGLQMSMYSNARGLVFKLSGYSDKQDVLLSQMLNNIESLVINPVIFARTKQRLRKSWANSFLQKPFRRLLMHLNEYAYQSSWPKIQMIEALDAIDERELAMFNKNVFKNAHVAMFVAGNTDQQQAKKLAQPIQQLLSNNMVERSVIKTAKLPVASTQEVVEVMHKDKAFNLYWQGEDNSPSQQVMWQLLSNMLEPVFFDQLRTQQQFGYIVFAQYYHLLDVPGMVFVVQSPQASIEQLDAAVNAFLQEQIARLSWLSESQLQKYKQVLAEDLNRPAKSLAEQSSRYWYNLVIHRSMQDKPLAQLEALDSLTLDQWKQFVKSLQSKEQRKLLLTTKSVPLGTRPKTPEFLKSLPEQEYSYP